MAIPDAKVRCELLRHILGRADRLVLPRGSHAVVREQALEDPLRLRARVADDHDSDAGRALDLVGVASDFLAMAKQDLLLCLDRLEAVAQVVGVGELRYEPQRDLLAATADEDRQVRLYGTRLVSHMLGVVAVAGRGRRLPREHPAHDRQRLREPAKPFRWPVPEFEAEVAGLVLVPGSPDAEVGPAAADVVQGRRHLGHECGVPVRISPDHESDPDPLRRGRPGRDRQPTLIERPVRVADDGVEMVPRPEAVVSEPFGPQTCIPQGGPIGVLVPAQQPDFEFVHSGSIDWELAARVCTVGSYESQVPLGTVKRAHVPDRLSLAPGNRRRGRERSFVWARITSYAPCTVFPSASGCR